MLMPSETEWVTSPRRAAGLRDPRLGGIDLESWVMLQASVRPQLTTPIIGLAMLVVHPIARMKARCGADRDHRSSRVIAPSHWLKSLFRVVPRFAVTTIDILLPTQRCDNVGCLNCATSIFGSIPVAA